MSETQRSGVWDLTRKKGRSAGGYQVLTLISLIGCLNCPLQLNMVYKTKSLIFLLKPLPFLVFSSLHRTMIHLLGQATQLLGSHSLFFLFSPFPHLQVLLALIQRLLLNRFLSTPFFDITLVLTAIIHSSGLITGENWKLSPSMTAMPWCY